MINDKRFWFNDEVKKLERIDCSGLIESSIEELESFCSQADKIIAELEKFLNSNRARRIS